MNSLDLLYARTESGLMVPRSALAPTPPSEEDQKRAIAALPRQQRRRIERQMRIQRRQIKQAVGLVPSINFGVDGG